jgi:hypothetical protein
MARGPDSLAAHDLGNMVARAEARVLPRRDGAT